MHEWTLPIDDGLRALDPPPAGGDAPQFVSADTSPDRIRARYFARDRDDSVEGHVYFGYAAQGPPGHAHGGAIAAVLDELMGYLAWEHSLTVVAAELWVKYRRPTPLKTELKLRAWIESVEGTRAELRSELRTADDELCCEGGGLFIHVGEARFAALTGGATVATRPEDG